MSWTFKAVECPSEDLSITNAVIVNELDFKDIRQVSITPTPHAEFVFTVMPHTSMQQGKMGFNSQHRKWAGLMLNADIPVKPCKLSSSTQSIGVLQLEADFFVKKGQQSLTIDSDEMAAEFCMQFSGRAFSVDEPLVFKYDKKLYFAQVMKIEVIDYSNVDAKGKMSGKPKVAQLGLLTPNSSIVFEKVEGSFLNFSGKSKGSCE